MSRQPPVADTVDGLRGGLRAFGFKDMHHTPVCKIDAHPDMLALLVKELNSIGQPIRQRQLTQC